jgi:hypothetical protein
VPETFFCLSNGEAFPLTGILHLISCSGEISNTFAAFSKTLPIHISMRRALSEVHRDNQFMGELKSQYVMDNKFSFFMRVARHIFRAAISGI